MQRIVLGSQSPRRREIMSYFSMPCEFASPNFDEESIPFQGDPEAFVTTLAECKAEILQPRFPDAIIITADTIVFRDGKLYGKPTTEDEAFKSFSELVGKWHTVYTGVAVLSGNAVHTQVETTGVLFNALSPEQIRHYMTHIPWADKSGGYTIQLAGGLIVNKIEGCYYNVMGLPVNTVHTLLKKVGVDLWDFM